MAVAVGIAGAFDWSVGWNWSGSEVRLIDGGADGDVGLIRGDFEGRNAVGERAVIAEERFDRFGEIGAVNGRGGRSVDGKARGRGVDAMMKDGARWGNVCEESVIAVDGEGDLPSGLMAGGVVDDNLGSISALTTDLRAGDLAVA